MFVNCRPDWLFVYTGLVPALFVSQPWNVKQARTKAFARSLKRNVTVPADLAEAVEHLRRAVELVLPGGIEGQQFRPQGGREGQVRVGAGKRAVALERHEHRVDPVQARAGEIWCR